MNIGIVLWFGGKKSPDYGFIEPLNFSQSNLAKDIFVHRKKILETSKTLRKNDVVTFEIQHTAKGAEATNVKLANAQNLVEATNFSDAAEFEKICAKLKLHNPALLKKFIAAIPQDLFKQYSWLRAKLPTNEYLNLCVEMYRENPAPELTDEIFSLLKTCEKLSPQILSQVPKEIILNPELLKKLSPQARLSIFELRLNDFEEYELATQVEELTKLNLFAEIVKIISASDNWARLFSVCIEKSLTKIKWAEVLLEDVAKLRQIEIPEDMLIILIYAAANGDKISDKFMKILADKINAHKDFYRAKVVYAYFRAGFANAQGNVAEREDFKKKADSFVADWFNLLANHPDDPAILPTFSLNEAFVFPPCQNSNAQKEFSNGKEIPCYFCEAVYWHNRTKTDGKWEEDKYGERVWVPDYSTSRIEPCNYCPRLNKTDDNEWCFRVDPNLKLPAEEWSLVELADKFKLGIDKEFFTRLGSEFNRLYELRERLKCRTCGEYMHRTKFADWKDVENLYEETKSEHFAVFASTTFQCQNSECYDREIVYLSYCWHCKGIIDSRDSSVRVKGYYLCEQCGAGYRDFDTPGSTSGGHYAIFPATICPHCLKCKCGSSDFDIIKTDFGFKLQCKSCGKIISAPLTILICKKCGGKDFNIVEYRDSNGKTKYKLKCQNCGTEITKIPGKSINCRKCRHPVKFDMYNLGKQAKFGSVYNVPWAE